ncbi:N-acetylgalactosamine-6-sulfatase, partial [Armadillidium nasatum]
RASLLTGRLPIRNGFYQTNIDGRNSYTPQEIVGGIPDSEILLHLGHQSQYLPLKHGFHHQFGSTNCHFGPYDNVSTPNIPDFVIDRTTGESNLTRMYTEEAVNFIQGRQNQENPFFMLWTPDSTHAPTFASQDFLHTSRRKTYGAATRELDAGVGSILAALDEVGLTNNTFVVFTSDNGPALVSKFDGGSNGPFLCGKQTTFEGGMRAPGIFYWPGTIPAGTTTHQVWTHMDLFSTLLELAGIDLPDDRFIDGLPLSRSLDDPDLEFLRPVLLPRNRLMAVRLGSYKMHLWTWNTTPEELEELLAAVEEHEAELVAGEPQLNWCDRAVMHWSPPGCEEIGQCLTVPESNPYLCDWPH